MGAQGHKFSTALQSEAFLPRPDNTTISGTDDLSVNAMRKAVISAGYASGEGHIPSALSVLDLLWVLYDRVLKVDPHDPGNPDRDIFILSKGHASLGLYAVLAEKGFFPPSELNGFCRYGSPLGGHPHWKKIRGVEASTGSLGHGFPMSVGIALGFKIQNRRNRVFALLGDGECNEGTVWESALLAAHHGLDNLCAIVDYNHSTDRALRLGDLTAKFDAFGWNARVIDGHCPGDIEEALRDASPGRPRAVIAETVKGRGCRLMENNPAWHHKAPTEEEYRLIMEELR